MDQEWMPIPNFTGYFCDRMGRIASRKMKDHKLLTIMSKAKQTVRITTKSNTATYDVHYLVALTFLPNSQNYKYVRHLNGNSWDNRPENLEWVKVESEYSSPNLDKEKMKAYVKNFSEWRTLPEYPNYYFHPDGSIVSVKQRVTPMKPIMKPSPSVILSSLKNGKEDKGMVQIAKLIAQAFIPNPHGYTEIIHIDGDHLNVKASNLKWDESSSTTVRDLNEETKDSDLWKPIDRFPGYLVSRNGELVSCKTKKYALMKPNAGDVWTTYRLRLDDENQPTIPVQLLLGLAFIPNPEGYQFVAPRNGDLQDYRLENLYWWSNPNGIPKAQWVSIKGFSDHEVSTLGIRHRLTKLLLTPTYRSGGDYPSVTMKNDAGIVKNKYVHVLIARNLIPNPEGLPVVNHKDGNHHNFSIENLEWCTYSQNAQHAHDTGLRDGSSSVVMIPTGQEIWKPVDIFPIYEISNTGIVRKRSKIMKLRLHLGYHMITLTSDGSKKYPYVHRLVAFAFLTTDHLCRPLDPDLVYEVNHKNKIRSDNRVENLEIISVKEHRGKDQGKAVVAINLTSGDCKDFDSIASMSNEMKISVRDISKAIRSQEDIKGWYFFFATDPDLEAKVDFLMENN